MADDAWENADEGAGTDTVGRSFSLPTGSVRYAKGLPVSPSCFCFNSADPPGEDVSITLSADGSELIFKSGDSFLLLPDATFVQSDTPVITLTGTGDKNNWQTLVLQYDTRAPGNTKFVFAHDRNVRYTMYLSTVSEVEEWLSVLSDLRDDMSCIPLDRMLNKPRGWLMHLKGELMMCKNTALKELYNKKWNQSEHILSELLLVYRNSVMRLDETSSPLRPQDASWFVEMLSVLMDSPMLRCAILSISLDNEAMSLFAGGIAGKRPPTGADYILFLLETKRSLTKLSLRSRSLFLYFLRFPGADREGGIIPAADPIYITPMSDPADKQWYDEREMRADRPSPSRSPKSLQEFRALVSSTGVLEYCRHYTKHIKALIHVMNTISEEEIINDLGAYVQLLFDVDASDVAQLFGVFVRRSLVTQHFYRAVLKVGVCAKNLPGLVHFMLNMLYEGIPDPSLAQCADFTNIAIKRVLDALPSFPIDFFNALYDQVMLNAQDPTKGIPKDQERLNLVIELLLCFEQVVADNRAYNNAMKMLSRWLSEATGKAAEERVEKVKQLFTEIDFESHIVKVYTNSVRDMMPASLLHSTSSLQPSDSLTNFSSFYRSREKVELVFFGFVKVRKSTRPPRMQPRHRIDAFHWFAALHCRGTPSGCHSLGPGHDCLDAG